MFLLSERLKPASELKSSYTFQLHSYAASN